MGIRQDGLEQISSVEPKVAALIAERDNYRTLLIQAGRSVPGVFLSDEVSAEFLLHIPEEIRLKIKALERLAEHLDGLQSELSKKCTAETAARLALHNEVVQLRERNAQLEELVSRGRNLPPARS